ncbi:uncharacterized protein LOC142609167 [Castanea sativa]|uniref:uncharacterized protein LOC142609167 n=1 Tax=Castanea sativa TaxID=21020 RepID=UPI003F64B0F4
MWVFVNKCLPMLTFKSCQRHNVETSSAVGASAAALVQLKLQHCAAGSASGHHQCASDQARHSDDITASVKATNMKIEELDDCLVAGSNSSQLKRIKKLRKSLIAKNKLGFVDGSLTISSPLVNSPTAAQGDQSLTDYFTQLKVLWDQLQNLSPFPQCTCGQCVCGINQRLKNLQAKKSTMKFLMGVNDALSQVKTQILLMDPLPSVKKAHSLFIQEEMQRFVTNRVRVESTVLATKSSSNNFKGKERPVGTHCGKMGHIVDKCYKLHGFPPGFKFKNNKNATAHQYQQLLTLIGSCSISQPTSGQASPVANVVTSTSNIVAVCSMKLMTSYTEISHTMVELPNGEAAVATHIGIIHLSSHITLTNVLCDLTCWSTIGMGQMHDGLYLLQGSSLDQATNSLADFLSKQSFKSFSAACSSNLSTNLFSLWHSRLGHPSDVKYYSSFVFSDFTSSTPSHSSLPISVDTIVQIHHDFDENIQNFPDASVQSGQPTVADTSNQPPIFLRRSTRPTKPPSYLASYHCNQISSAPIPVSSISGKGTSHPLPSYISYANLSPSYKSFCCAISSILEPIFYHQAVGNPKWQDAMDAELMHWKLTIHGPSLHCH